MALCASLKGNGEPCSLSPMPGKDVCRFHPKDATDKEAHREMSRRGGRVKGYPSIAPLSAIPGVLELDLESALGLRAFLAHTLRGLAQLPLDVKTANAIAQVVTCARAVIETSDHEERLAAIEAASQPGLKRA